MCDAACVYMVYNHSCHFIMGVANTLEQAKRLCPMSQVMEDETICVHRVTLDKVYDGDADNGALTNETVVYPL